MRASSSHLRRKHQPGVTLLRLVLRLGLLGGVRDENALRESLLDPRAVRDDLEAVGHILVYLILGYLPWQGMKGKSEKEKTENKKGLFTSFWL